MTQFHNYLQSSDDEVDECGEKKKKEEEKEEYECLEADESVEKCDDIPEHEDKKELLDGIKEKLVKKHEEEEVIATECEEEEKKHEGLLHKLHRTNSSVSLSTYHQHFTPFTFFLLSDNIRESSPVPLGILYIPTCVGFNIYPYALMSQYAQFSVLVENGHFVQLTI